MHTWVKETNRAILYRNRKVLLDYDKWKRSVHPKTETNRHAVMVWQKVLYHGEFDPGSG